MAKRIRSKFWASGRHFAISVYWYKKGFYGKGWSSKLFISAKIQEALTKAVKLIAFCLLPYFNYCLLILFPYEKCSRQFYNTAISFEDYVSTRVEGLMFFHFCCKHWFWYLIWFFICTGKTLFLTSKGTIWRLHQRQYFQRNYWRGRCHPWQRFCFTNGFARIPSQPWKIFRLQGVRGAWK